MKFRNIKSILLLLALNAASLGITHVIIIEVFPHIPDAFWTFLYSSSATEIILGAALQILAFALYLKIFEVLYRAFLGLYRQEADTVKPVKRRPPPAPAPFQTVPATVSGKRVKTKRYARERLPVIRHFLGFRLDDGQELWFEANDKEYRRLAEGDHGQLAFQGKSYRSFQKDGEGMY